MAFIYSRSSVLPTGASLERDTLVQGAGRYLLPDGVTLKAWCQAIARGLGRSTVDNVLARRNTGWINALLTRTLEHVSTEMSSHVFYHLKRLINMLGIAGTIKAIKSERA